VKGIPEREKGTLRMNYGFWFFMVGKIITPTNLSWVVIAGPVLVLAITIVVNRSRAYPPKGKGAWREIGRRWRSVGLVLCLASVLLWVGVACLSGRYDRPFRNELIRASERRAGRAVKDEIREFAEGVPEKTLYNVVVDCCNKPERDPDVLCRIIQAWCSTYLTKPVTIFYDRLYWPPARIEKYEQDFDGKRPAVLAAGGLQYDEQQEQLLEQKKFVELNRSLRPAQRRSLLHQFISPLERDIQVDLLVNACDFLTADEVQDLRTELADRFFQDSLESERIAWNAGDRSQANAAQFVLCQIRWLREVLWAVIYSALAVWIVVKGSRLIREGRPNLFRVN